MSEFEKKEKALRVLRWTVRGIGLIFFIPMIFQTFDQGIPDLSPLPIEQKMVFGALFIIWLAFFIGIFFELIGGLLIFVSLFFIAYIEGTINIGGFFLIALLIAIGYVWVWFENRRLKKHRKE
ncbi:MAG: hypothetical protein ACEPOW_04125 [Bacteroidales bacterium]